MQPYISSELIDVDPGMVTKAQNGDSFAQLDLGKKYFSAYDLQDNCFTAFKWISLSAQQGNMEAQFRLADLYALGQGTEQSHTRAYEWYTKSAIQGCPKALIRIHNLYEDDKFMHCKGFQNQAEEYEWNILDTDDYGPQMYTQAYRLKRSNLILNKAREYYQQQLNNYLLSELEDRNIQLNLGFIYQHGYGTRRDVNFAIKYYTMAANQDSVEAQYNLGEIYQKYGNIQNSNQQAFRWYSKAAENGSVAAKNRLGSLYEKGIGVEKNYSKALYWYTQAANKRYTSAQINAARMYRTGQGVAQDYTKAIRWYTMAAKEGSKVAQNCLDQILSQQEATITKNENASLVHHYNDPINRERACSLLRKHISEVTDTKTKKALKKLAMNAMRGDINAMYEIGLKYRDGIDLPQDRDLYFKWIKNSAKRGCLKAQYDVGKSYENGHDDEQSYYKASIWYKKGSRKKEDLFQYHLGMMYFNGYGVRHDPLEASKLFYQSAEKNNTDSQYQFGYMRLYGYGLRKDFSAAFDYLIKSANQRNCEAMYEVGKAYVEGEVIKQDTTKGISWLMRAFRYKSGLAGMKLIKLYKNHKSKLAELGLSKIFLQVEDEESFKNDNSFFLAKEYLHGDVVEQDYIKAFAYFKKSMQSLDNLEDQFSTPAILQGINCDDLFNMYKRVSEEGIAKLEYNIGYAHEYGIQNVYTLKIVLDSNIAEATKWYTTASKKGDSRSFYRLGAIHETGKGTEKDISTAISFYSKGAEKHNPDAMYRLAVLYLIGNGVSQNFKKAYDLFLESHNLGHKCSRLFLKISGNSSRSKPFGLVLTRGVSTEEEDENELLYYSDEEQSNRLSLQMLEAVADMGKISVQYQLGCLYEKDGDYSKAAYWFDRSLEGGITDTYYRLGVLYEEGLGIQKDCLKARTVYQKAADKKHDMALYRLARLYHYGTDITAEYHKAFILYKEAADEGNKEAQKIIGLLEVPENHSTTEKANREIHSLTTMEIEKSLTMYECVARNGDTGLQFQLGRFYESKSFEPDYTKAAQWYSLADASNHADATYCIGKLHELGLGVPQDYTIAIKLYDKARELGCTKAIYRLGNIYQNGLGVDKDYEKAFQYYTEASRQGCTDAQYRLGKMYDSIEYNVHDTLKALEWYTKSYSQGNDNARHRLALLDDDDKPYETFFYKRLAGILVRYMKIENNYNNTKEYIDPDMCSRLSDIYFKGKGIEKNYQKAWYYLVMAVGLKFDRDQYIYGDSVLRGKTSMTIKENALKVHDIALLKLESGDSVSCILLGLMYLGGITLLHKSDEDRKTYISIFENNFDLSDESSFRNNSAIGSIVIPRDQEKAFTYFIKAAKIGDDYCKMIVGQMYQCGYGVEQDFSKAMEYFQDVSKKSFLYDYFVKQYIGLLYLFGDVAEPDDIQAFDLIQDDNYLFRHNFNVGQLYYYGWGVDQNYKTAFSHLTRANMIIHCQQLNVVVRFKESTSNESSEKYQREYIMISGEALRSEVYYQIGMMYEKSQGVVKNAETALLKFKKSAKCGNQKAQRHLDLYYNDIED